METIRVPLSPTKQKAMKSQSNPTLHVHICLSSEVRSYFHYQVEYKRWGNKQILIHIPMAKVDKHEDSILKTYHIHPTQKA